MPVSRCGRPDIRCWRTSIASPIWRASFELSGGVSFRGFVEELEAQSEKAESAEAPVLEEGAEGVRLMTVHAAKGLEFPVVILADMTANIAAGDPDRYVDAREAAVCDTPVALRALGTARE